MTSKERFRITINGGKPDRPPIFATFTPQVAEKVSSFMGLPYDPPIDSLLSTRISHTNLLIALGNDAVGIAACTPSDFVPAVQESGITVNEWGMRFKNIGLYNEFIHFPLAFAETAGDIVDYPFPEPHAPGRFDFAREAVTKYGRNYGLIGDLETTIFETAWYLVGLEKLLTDLMQESDYVEPLLDRIMHINLQIGLELIRMGVDVIWCGDDFGGQNGMIMSPELWREISKPRIRMIFEAFRRENPNVKIAWHSCGSIVPIIPDFIEIGLDILNPLQPLARDMDPLFLKRKFGRDLIFFGGIDVQELLPYGNPQQIKDQVRRCIKILGKEGGYIAAPAHNIQNDTPVENILAMYEAIKSCGY